MDMGKHRYFWQVQIKADYITLMLVHRRGRDVDISICAVHIIGSNMQTHITYGKRGHRREERYRI